MLAASSKNFEKELMRHLLTSFLLWLISKNKTHGYGLIKLMRSEDKTTCASPSKIYPLLKELKARGLIAQKREMHGKRAKKVYHVTEKGLKVLREAKEFMAQKPLKRSFLKEMVG